MPINTDSSSTPLMESSDHDRQQHHEECTFKCTIIYSEYGCGKQSRKPVRVLKSWKCERQEAGVWPILKDLAHSLFVSSGIVFLSFETWLFPTFKFITNGLVLSPETRVMLAKWLMFNILPLIVALWLAKVTFDYWNVVLSAIHFLFVTWPDMVDRWAEIVTDWLLEAIGDLWGRLWNRLEASTSPPTCEGSLAVSCGDCECPVCRGADPDNIAGSFCSDWEISDEDEDLM